MNQVSFEFPLTDFEEITAKYFSEGKKPTKKHIAMAVKKCRKWNSDRIKLGLKVWR
ncbi:MAG: hypothetical protein MJK15_03165 [Colwellia sp.]|nr:hypothetical protein [Colwellia sp.]